MQSVSILLLSHSCVLVWSKQVGPVKYWILPLTNKVKKGEGVQSRSWSWDSFLPPLDSPTAPHQRWSPGWSPQHTAPHEPMAGSVPGLSGVSVNTFMTGHHVPESGLWARISCLCGRSLHDPGHREATAGWWKSGHLAHRPQLLI